MRRLIARPLVLLLTFLMGLFVTVLLTFAGDGLARLLYEPSESIPALCPEVGSLGRLRGGPVPLLEEKFAPGGTFPKAIGKRGGAHASML
jgi:hypothetical protein